VLLFVQILQVLSGTLWLFPAAILFPSVLRTWRNRATILDVLSTPMFFVSCIFILGAIRWIAWHSTLSRMRGDELLFWSGIYVMSILAAVGVAWSHHHLTRATKHG
jgi:hypothetical protein